MDQKYIILILKLLNVIKKYYIKRIYNQQINS